MAHSLQPVPAWRQCVAPLAGAALSVLLFVLLALALRSTHSRPLRGLSTNGVTLVVAGMLFTFGLLGAVLGARIAPRGYLGFVQGALLMAGVFIAFSAKNFGKDPLDWLLTLTVMAGPLWPYFRAQRRSRVPEEASFQFEEPLPE
ncbi:hypothetical protein [Flaviaesturariibacter aridisoli]|uniref:Uncharacterized protein n=1 Tax=Flaviaesturariibacter aridisoli TaxID=2545761 RepID=A0A4R4E2V0_9BACT|nr:hypothetical protein [Flaviaesturariibacter aridisoli]TCZ73729.1 hypothetical protein E0486_05450 [Flaviaesturariibacter aridisoli]